MATNLATVKEATEALGISRSTLWRRIRSGDISSISRGGRRLVQLPSRRAVTRAKLAGDLPAFMEKAIRSFAQWVQAAVVVNLARATNTRFLTNERQTSRFAGLMR